MSEAVKYELYIFGISILTGVAAGIIFDFFRAVRRCGRGCGSAVAHCDILLWISEAVLVFAAIYNFNSGQLRFYIFIGMAAGGALYFLTLSRLLLWLFVKLYCVFGFILGKILKLFKIFIKPIAFLLKKMLKILKNIQIRGKKLKKQLKMY